MKSFDSYAHLERDGLPVPEEFYRVEEVRFRGFSRKNQPSKIFGRSTWRVPSSTGKRESSMMVRHGEEGWSQQRFRYRVIGLGRPIRITLRTNKIPELGDKFASHPIRGIIGRIVEGHALHCGWNTTV